MTELADTPHVQIAIAGAGFAGLGLAIRLKQEGITDFVLFERADDVGGTWRDNTYPGCACDVPSHLYSFSFAPKADWSTTFSPQPEIQAYLRDCARRYGVVGHLRGGHEVRAAAWDDATQRWVVETAGGTYTADVLVSAMGGLSEPAIPRLPGIETFEGRAFHSARWDHDYDLEGKRVAVVGTGASAIQFVPQIQPRVERLTLFQRTPPWIMPRADRPLARWEHALYRAFPPAQLAMRAGIYWAREGYVLPFMHPRLSAIPERMARRHMLAQVTDPELRRKVMPDYRIGCKRILLSDDYLPALGQPNVDVVTDGIREVRARSIVDGAGVEHEVDAILYGTGFRVTDAPVGDLVRGRDGRTLAETWEGSMRAHLGTTVHGFPNLFLMVGPNTGLGHNSIVFMIEAQIAHVLGALRHLRRTGAAALEPTAAAQAAFVAEVDREMEGTVWTAGGCASWYQDATGRVSALWPGFTYPFKRRLERFDPGEYAVHARRPAAEPVAA